MTARNVVVGISVALMAWSLDMNILQWQTWVFVIATIVALEFSSHKSKN